MRGRSDRVAMSPVLRIRRRPRGSVRGVQRRGGRRRAGAASRRGTGDWLHPPRRLQSTGVLREGVVRRFAGNVPAAAGRVQQRVRPGMWMRRRELLERLPSSADRDCRERAGRVHHSGDAVRRDPRFRLPDRGCVLRQAPRSRDARLPAVGHIGRLLVRADGLPRRRRTHVGELQRRPARVRGSVHRNSVRKSVSPLFRAVVLVTAPVAGIQNIRRRDRGTPREPSSSSRLRVSGREAILYLVGR